MANLRRTIEILLEGTDHLSPIFNQASENLQGFKGAIDSSGDNINTFILSVVKAQTAITSLASVYAHEAVKSAQEFENAQIDLTKVIDKSDPSLESFSNTALKLSEEYGKSASAILVGIAGFKQAGFTAKEAALLQKDALDLVISGDVTAAQATELLVASLKGFKAEAKEAPRFIEAMNNVSNVYATDLKQLAVGMSQISPIAKKMGFSFEETTGLLTPVIEVFRSGSEGANALKTGLLKLIDTSAPVAKALKDIGVSQKDANGKLKSGKDILNEVGEAFKNLDRNQKLQITSQLVGSDQAGKMVEVFDQLGKVQAITATAMAKTGSVAQEVGLRLKSSSGQVERFQQTFKNLNIEIGKKLIPSFNKLTGGLTAVTASLRDTAKAGALDELFDAVDKGTGGFTKTLEELAKNIPKAFEGLDFSGLIEQFGAISTSLGGIFDGLNLSSAEGLENVMQGIVNIFTRMTQVVAVVIEDLKPIVVLFSDWASALSPAVEGSESLILTVLDLGEGLKVASVLMEKSSDAMNTFATAADLFAKLKSPQVVAALTNAFNLLTPTLGLAIAAFASIAFGIYRVSEAYDDLQTRNNVIADSTRNIQERSSKLVDAFKKISKETGIRVKSAEELYKAEKAGLIVYDDQLQAYSSVADSLQRVEQARLDVSDASLNEAIIAKTVVDINRELIDSNNKLGVSKKTLRSELVKANGAAERYYEVMRNNVLVALDTWNKAGKRTRQVTNEVTGEVVTLTDKQLKLSDRLQKADGEGKRYTKTMKNGIISGLKVWGESQKGVNETLKNAKDDLDKLTNREIEAIKQADELSKTLLNLASNERIKNMEFRANINVAEIQADAQIAIAAFNSVASVVKSTSDAVANIYSAGRNENDAFGFEFSNQLDKANARADKALTNATNLTNAQIKQMEAKTRAIIRGDANIKIIGEGLTPVLQEVLRTLMEEIQIQANSEGLELLL